MLRFLGIGAQKAGTTWLYERLKLHPEIGFPAGKELHFWDEQGHLGLDWYRARFSDAKRIEGEITPAYGMLAPTTIQAIQAAFPDLRLILLCRNPIDRAWSSALMAMHRAELTIDEASDQWFIDHFRSAGSLARGDYAATIANWSAAFGRERVLVLDFDDLSRDPVGLLQACCRHIGAEPRHFESYDPKVLAGIVFAGASIPLPANLKAELVDLYRDRIKALASVLPFDTTPWLAAHTNKKARLSRALLRGFGRS